MINISKVDAIYLAPGATDLRKAIDGCSAMVQYQMHKDPFSNSIFIFCNRHKNIIKVLQWDGNGFWLHTKKLIGKDKFRWPKVGEYTSLMIDKRQLEWLFSGLEIHQKYAHHPVEALVDYVP
jgi:transposase